MIWSQNTLTLPPFPRGCHLITVHVVRAFAEIKDVKAGLLHLFLQHTSASLTINENADPDVRRDLEMAGSRLIPEDWPYAHDAEGKDDMPAHIKTSLAGCDLTIPVTDGKLHLGTWQGIYLWEHRNQASARTIVMTLCGRRS